MTELSLTALRLKSVSQAEKLSPTDCGAWWETALISSFVCNQWLWTTKSFICCSEMGDIGAILCSDYMYMDIIIWKTYCLQIEGRCFQNVFICWVRLYLWCKLQRMMNTNRVISCPKIGTNDNRRIWRNQLDHWIRFWHWSFDDWVCASWWMNHAIIESEQLDFKLLNIFLAVPFDIFPICLSARIISSRDPPKLSLSESLSMKCANTIMTIVVD